MTLRLALAQIDTTVGDLAANSAAVVSWAARAAEAGARVVVFPEMTITGYPAEDLVLRASFQRAAHEAVQDVARRLVEAGLGDLTVVVGTLGAPASEPLPTNRAVALRDGGVVARYDKQHLPNYGVFDEFRIFSSGHGPTVVEVDGHPLGIAICEDVWQDEGPVAQLTGADVEALLVLNGSPYEQGKGQARLDLARRRAAELGAPVVYVNLVGGQDDLVFDGGSFVVGPGGALLAQAPQLVEHLLVLDLDDPSSTIAAVPPPSMTPIVLDPVEEVYRAATLGLADYARKTGFSTAVLGLSGGIDSALVAAMAADALGGENVLGVAMPSVISSPRSLDDAADLAARLGAVFRVVPIAPMVDAFQSHLGLDGVAAENLQARVRGVIVMGLSNQEGRLALATGNKSELSVGYSTIYGDAVGGYAPLKDIDKSLVWELARWRNAQARAAGQTEPIPESSITKAPSAELRPGQVDQDSLPDYALLDEVLDAYIEHAEGRAELLARGFDAATVDKVVTLVDRAEWKRRQYPLGPKVTGLAFGRDRRLPVTSRWREPDDDVPASTDRTTDPTTATEQP